MKTKIFLMGLLMGFSVHIFAQDTRVYESQLPGYQTNFKHSAAGENWFINLSAGGQLYNIDKSYDGAGITNPKNLTDRISLIPAVAIGKWFTPYFALRLKGQGLKVNSYLVQPDKSLFTNPNNYLNVHLDAMLDLTNYWGVYSPEKLFNFTPYVGLGWAHRSKLESGAAYPMNGIRSADNFRKYADAFSINGGIQFGFRLSERVNLDFDLGVTYLGDYFDRMETHNGENDNILHAMGGFTFKLGKATFEVVEPMDYALIDDLNRRINALKDENNRLSKRPAYCPECPPPAAPAPSIIKNEINYVPNVVFFRLNSAKIDDNQQVSVFNTANFVKETGERIKVIGYADRGTGTSPYNLALSERRARAVAKELITRYGIPSEKITVEWKGSNEQPYPQNNWNRVVIMSAQ